MRSSAGSGFPRGGARRRALGASPGLQEARPRLSRGAAGQALSLPSPVNVGGKGPGRKNAVPGTGPREGALTAPRWAQPALQDTEKPALEQGASTRTQRGILPPGPSCSQEQTPQVIGAPLLQTSRACAALGGEGRGGAQSFSSSWRGGCGHGACTSTMKPGCSG